MGLWRNHPSAKRLRVLAVHIDAGDAVVENDTVTELELAVEVDLDKRSAVGLLSLVKLVPSVSASSLPVVELIEGFSEDLAEAFASRIHHPEMGDHCVELWIRRRRHGPA